jgi:hypothetical protein
MKIIIILLLFFISCVILANIGKIQENLISFTAPELSSENDKKSMAELMRLGSQGNENSKYDTVDTKYLQ